MSAYAFEKAEIHNYAAQNLEWQPCKNMKTQEKTGKNKAGKQAELRQPGIVIASESGAGKSWEYVASEVSGSV